MIFTDLEAEKATEELERAKSLAPQRALYSTVSAIAPAGRDISEGRNAPTLTERGDLAAQLCDQNERLPLSTSKEVSTASHCAAAFSKAAGGAKQTSWTPWRPSAKTP